jgi:hypothetical protein
MAPLLDDEDGRGFVKAVGQVLVEQEFHAGIW